MADLPPFHLAITVHDLAQARKFYGEVLGCPEGRSSDCWVDFDFFGHQLVTHLDATSQPSSTNTVDGEEVPVRHFGVVLTMDAWHQLSKKLALKGVMFLIEPQIRFQNQPGEQATMFIRDPSGNALEFKAFADPSRLFAK